MVDNTVKQTLLQIKEFVNRYVTTLQDEGISEPSKQAFFLDNQEEVRSTMEILTQYENIYSIENENTATEEEIKMYELICTLKNRLTQSLKDYKDNFKKIDPNVQKEDTTVIVNEETIKDAMMNNASTKQLIEDMNELSQASVKNSAPYTHVIVAGNKYFYCNATTKAQLNTCINEVADSVPANVSVKVFELSMAEIKLNKVQKTVYSV